MPGETELKVYLLSSLSNIPPFLLWGLVAILGVGCVVLVLRKGWKGGLRSSAVLMLVEWVFIILCTAVIFRDVRVERDCNLIPFASYFHYPENSYFIEAAAINVLNIIMFIPVGLLLGLGFREMTWKKALLAGLGLSFFIELSQFIFKRGLCEVDDLIHNVAGCAAGYGIYCLLAWVCRKAREVQRG